MIHVAAWPAHFGPASDMQDSSILAARSLAYQLKAFVISSCAIVTDELIDAYGPSEEDRQQLETLKGLGGTCIVGPRGKVIAGPMEAGEGILYCDIDTQDVIIPKMIHDFAGHYNRPDVFSVTINGSEPRLLTRHQGSEPTMLDYEARSARRSTAAVEEERTYYLEGPRGERS